MRRLLVLSLITALLASGSTLADEVGDCHQHKDPEVRIKICSEIIRRHPADATAYYHRAVAYELIGDIDRAIADYSKTIELAPENAAAYDNRGRAYARKGDYTRALADETKSSELAGKIAAQSRVPKTATILPTQERTRYHRQRFTPWWCCRELVGGLPARWLRLLNCRVTALRHPAS
jgi:tetratricopeptide (TPR) repeat protein